MFEQGDILSLADNKKYVVIDQFADKGKSYIYLMDSEDKANVIFGKLEKDEIVEIKYGDEFDYVIKKFNERLHQN